MTARQPMADLNRALACSSESDAFDGLLRAAHAGCLRAQSLVGLAYHTGRGVPVDFECAATWYRKAAAGGDSYAIANLGVLSLGNGPLADEIDAYTWLQSAVGLGRESLRPALALLERRIQGDPDCPSAAPILNSVSPEIPPVHACLMPACDPCRCEAI